MEEDRPRWWSPEYRALDDELVVIEGCATNECPVSLVTGFSQEMVDRSWNLHQLKELNMSTPLDDQPFREVEALLVIEAERDKANNVINSKRPSPIPELID